MLEAIFLDGAHAFRASGNDIPGFDVVVEEGALVDDDLLAVEGEAYVAGEFHSVAVRGEIILIFRFRGSLLKLGFQGVVA